MASGAGDDLRLVYWAVWAVEQWSRLQRWAGRLVVWLRPAGWLGVGAFLIPLVVGVAVSLLGRLWNLPIEKAVAFTGAVGVAASVAASGRCVQLLTRAKRLFGRGLSARHESFVVAAAGQRCFFLAFSLLWSGVLILIAAGVRLASGETLPAFMIGGTLLGVSAASLIGAIKLERTVFWLVAAKCRPPQMPWDWMAGRYGFDGVVRLEHSLGVDLSGLASQLASSSKSGPEGSPVKLRLDQDRDWPGRSVVGEMRVRTVGALSYGVIGLTAGLLAYLICLLFPMSPYPGSWQVDPFQNNTSSQDGDHPEQPKTGDHSTESAIEQTIPAQGVGSPDHGADGLSEHTDVQGDGFSGPAGRIGNDRDGSSSRGKAGGSGQPNSSGQGRGDASGQPNSAGRGKSGGAGQPNAAGEDQGGASGQPNSSSEGQAGGAGQPKAAGQDQGDASGQPNSAGRGKSGGAGQPNAAGQDQSAASKQANSSGQGKSGGAGQPNPAGQDQGAASKQANAAGQGQASGADAARQDQAATPNQANPAGQDLAGQSQATMGRAQDQTASGLADQTGAGPSAGTGTVSTIDAPSPQPNGPAKVIQAGSGNNTGRSASNGNLGQATNGPDLTERQAAEVSSSKSADEARDLLFNGQMLADRGARPSEIVDIAADRNRSERPPRPYEPHQSLPKWMSDLIAGREG